MKTNNNQGCSNGCGALGIILGIIIAVVIAVLFALGFIPLILTGIWTALGIAGVLLFFVLALVLLRTFCSSCDRGECLRRYIRCLLAGILGTILSALALVSVTLDIAVAAIVILVAIGAFFFAFMIAGFISFIKCLVYSS